MNEGFYNGAGLNLRGSGFGGQMSAQQVTPFANEYIGRVGTSGAGALDSLLSGFTDTMAYAHYASLKKKRGEIQQKREQEFSAGLEAAPGTPKSFFLEDGSPDVDRLDSFYRGYTEEVAELRPTLMPQEYVREWDDFTANSEKRMKGIAMQHAAAAVKRVAKATLAEAESQGDIRAYCNEVDRQVEAGILMQSEANVLKRGMMMSGVRRLGRASRSAVVPPMVTLGGKEYSGANAALAMSATEAAEESAREVIPTAEVPQDGAMVAPQSAVVAPEEVVAPQQLSVFGGPMVVSSNSLDAYTMLPESERTALVDDFAFDRKVITQTDDMGKEHFSCPVTAPEAVQRVAAQAELKGELDVDTCRGMVARITMDAAVENPDVSTEQILKQFDDSGIYAALGAGDAEVGMARTRAIVEEMRQRAQAGTTKVNMATIERMVKAKVHEPTFGAGQEWKSMEALDPMLKKSDGTYPEWEKGSDDVQRKKWFALYDVYKKYRSVYNPFAEGEADRDDFNENAGAFYAWYKENVYPQQKKAAQDAAKDYYTAAVVEELRGRVDVNQTGQAFYKGYANEVTLARDVLSKPLPSDLGVAALAQREKAIQQGDVDLSKSFRETAAEDYKKLGKMKQAEAENSAAARKAKERQEAAEKREAEKAAKDAEKRAEQQEARRLFVARSQPRDCAWVWDGQNAPDGEQPLCTVPVEEYQRLQQELGYDGTQLVYLRVGNSKVLVVGTNDTGKIQLNTPAVMKIQARPNAKKGEKWRVNGQLGYSYQFTNAK